MSTKDSDAVAQGAIFKVIPPPKPTAWQRFKKQPFLFIARKLYEWRRITPFESSNKPVSVVCVSNTYYQHPEIPKGDVLIHAGDLSPDGSRAHFQRTLDWLNEQSHSIKIVVAGMTDQLMDRHRDAGRCWDREDRDKIDWGDIIYLENSGITLLAPNGKRLRIWGSPCSPIREKKLGFQYPRDKSFWKGKIPETVDILITHTPPYGHLDSSTGCYHLLHELWENPPRLHVFGRARENYGTEVLQYDKLQASVEFMIGRDEGLKELWQVIKGFVLSWVCPATGRRTLLVNACITGGFWDMTRRGPIKVVI